jgi:hypothetical protein
MPNGLNGFSFSGRSALFLQAEILKIHPNLKAIFALFERVVSNETIHTEFVYWGYGNLQKELQKLLPDVTISLHRPTHFNFIMPTGDPQAQLRSLKKRFPPLVQ